MSNLVLSINSTFFPSCASPPHCRGDRTAKHLFANPGRSNQDMVLQLMIQNRVILQSGRILPGNQVEKLDVPPEAAAMLMAGGYEGVFLIHFYDRSSGEKAIVTTEIPVSVIVAE